MANQFQVGDILKTHFGETVTVIAIETNPKLKPLVVSNNGKTEYYHLDQVEKV